jgi:hypothetical protein
MGADSVFQSQQSTESNPLINRALEAYAHQAGTHWNSQYCQQALEEAYGRNVPNYKSAKAAYEAQNKAGNVQIGVPPAGAAVYYQGNAANGHVALSAGNGYVWSTDANGDKVGKVKYDQLWGGTGSGKYLGYTTFGMKGIQSGTGTADFTSTAATPKSAASPVETPISAPAAPATTPAGPTKLGNFGVTPSMPTLS